MKKVKKITKSKTGLISPHAVKTIMLARPKIKPVYPRYSPPLSFSSTISSKYFKYFLVKFWGWFSKPSKGLHLIRDIIHQIHFLPKHSLQTQHVYRNFKSSTHISLIHFAPFEIFLFFMRTKWLCYLQEF